MTAKAPSIKYKKLARGTEGMMVRCSLWLGDDHLLAVKSSGYIENYSRFYLKDIGGLIWQRTSKGLITNIVLGAVLFLMLLTGASTYDGTFNGVAIFLVIFGTPLLIALLWNLIKGTTCSCQIITPLGPVAMPAISRVSTVKSLLNRLRPLIANQQGSLPRSELLSRYQAMYSNSENRMP